MHTLRVKILRFLGISSKDSSDLIDEYECYFSPKNSNDSVERRVTAVHSRGNVSLSKGRYVNKEDYKKKIEFVKNYDLDTVCKQ